MNNFQRDRFARHVISSLNNSLRNKKITILGYAFKKNTGDARESPALDVIRNLLEESPKCIAIFDPLCSEADIRRELLVLCEGGVMRPHGPVEVKSDPYAACADTDAILVLTDWDIFQTRPAILIEPTPKADQLDGAALTTPLNLKRKRETTHSKPPTPPQTPKIAGLTNDAMSMLLPEPPCPPNCVECESGEKYGTMFEKDLSTTLDWRAIFRTAREPKWVFDGRGILNAQQMVEMGFRLETLGRANLY